MAEHQKNARSKPRDERVNLLFEAEQWGKARKLLEAERVKSPNSHWILTQLAVTFYEEKHYKSALGLLIESLTIKDDCPLTLWNLAGTLGALGKYDEAGSILIWILKSKASAKDDKHEKFLKAKQDDWLVLIGQSARRAASVKKWFLGKVSG